MNVDGKIAIVTGASSGIGLAVSKLLTEKGAKVALVSRSEKKLEAISKKLPGSIVITVDMSKENEIADMVKKVKKHFGRIDILINNAGQGYDASIENTNIDTFHKIFDLDVVGPLVAMQNVIPIMKRQRSGSIINISSGTALMSLPNMGAYSSIKRALAGISLTAREELKDKNINVSVVYPYITETDFEKNTTKAPGTRTFSDSSNGYKPPKADTAEYVAEKILDAITTGDAEIFAHDWMKHK